jgi:hypothetical protein
MADTATIVAMDSALSRRSGDPIADPALRIDPSHLASDFSLWRDRHFAS